MPEPPPQEDTHPTVCRSCAFYKRPASNPQLLVLYGTGHLGLLGGVDDLHMIVVKQVPGGVVQLGCRQLKADLRLNKV